MERPPSRPGGPFAFDAGCSGYSPVARAPNLGYARRHGSKVTALVRAFQLARSGSVAGLTDMIASLKREGYSAGQIEGPPLKRQLADLIKASRGGTSHDGQDSARGP